MNHDNYSNAYLKHILTDCHTVAVVGASKRQGRASHWVIGFLLGKGYRVFPVNPNLAGSEILGQHVYASLADIPEPIDLVDVFRNSQALPALVEEILDLPERPLAIWGQVGVRHDGAAARAEAEGIEVVMDRTLVAEYPLVYAATHPEAKAAATIA